MRFALLTIGDGLVAQLPSLLLSTSAAIIVTGYRPEDLGSQVATQLLNNPRALMITAGDPGHARLIPGMPNLVFLLLGGGRWTCLHGRQAPANSLPRSGDRAAAPVAVPETGSDVRELTWQDAAGRRDRSRGRLSP